MVVLDIGKLWRASPWVRKATPQSQEGRAERGNWSSPLEFILSCLSYAVGLGNVWRFPYLCYRNGGGAFLVPHTIMIFAAGLPLFFLELVVGQYSSLGPSEAFQKMAPIFHGLGFSTLVVIVLVTIYYHVIIAWTILYMVYSLIYSELPWGSCSNEFNTASCFSELLDRNCLQGSHMNKDWYGYENGIIASESLILASNTSYETLFEPNNYGMMTFWNQSCHYVSSICETRGYLALPENNTHCFNAVNGTAITLHKLLNRVLSSEEFYSRYVLGAGLGADWENWGGLQWRVLLSLLIAWIIAAFCLIKGVASAGKVMYFTALFPYVVLFALLIRGATLDGAADGIYYYINPKWEILTTAAVWGDASSQVFYALGLGCGSLVTLSSYNDFHNNCHRDALIVTVVNCFTSVLAGFSIFAILGFLANRMGVTVPDVVNSGPGLAFVAYPEAVLHMPLPQLWAFLFFFMLFCLGLGSQIAGLESITTAVMDKWPNLRAHKALVAMGTCAVCFVAGIPMCFDGGVYLFTLLDWNTAAWSILIIGLAETILVGWVYGSEKFMENISEMGMKIPKFVKWYWKGCWIVVSPVMLLGVLIFSFYEITPAYYADYIFPSWVDGLGWLLGIVSVLPLPAFAIYRIFKGKEKGADLFLPTKDWRPAVLKDALEMSDSKNVDNGINYDNSAFEIDVIDTNIGTKL